MNPKSSLVKTCANKVTTKSGSGALSHSCTEEEHLLRMRIQNSLVLGAWPAELPSHS